MNEEIKRRPVVDNQAKTKEAMRKWCKAIHCGGYRGDDSICEWFCSYVEKYEKGGYANGQGD